MAHRLVRTRKLKEKHPSLKIMVSVGGHYTTTHVVARMLAEPDKRSEFAHNCVAFLRKLGIDGPDLSFDNPRYGNGLAMDREQFSLLVKVRLFSDGFRRFANAVVLALTVD